MTVGSLRHRRRVVALGLTAATSVTALLPATLGSPVAHAEPGAAVLSVGNAAALEGSSGTHTVIVPVTLSSPAASTVTVAWSLFEDWNVLDDGVAQPATQISGPGDYVVRHGTVTFRPGAVRQRIVVRLVADAVIEDDERFTVRLASPVGATLGDADGTVTILDDDSAPGFAVGIGDVSVREGDLGNRAIDLPVVFSGPAPTAFSLTVTRAPGSNAAPGSPTTERTYAVRQGARAKALRIVLAADTAAEPTETFAVGITAQLGTVVRSDGTVLVRDDDGTVPNRPGRRPGPPRITLVGDSITAGYAATAKSALELQGWAVTMRATPGVSLLDSASCAGERAQAVVDDLDPDIVIMESFGNYGFWPTCHPGLVVNSPEFFALLDAASRLHADVLSSSGATVHWIVNPQVPDEPHRTTISRINASVATIAGIELIDAHGPFGGDSPVCEELRAYDCWHLAPAGAELMTQLVVAAVE